MHFRVLYTYRLESCLMAFASIILISLSNFILRLFSSHSPDRLMQPILRCVLRVVFHHRHKSHKCSTTKLLSCPRVLDSNHRHLSSRYGGSQTLFDLKGHELWNLLFIGILIMQINMLLNVIAERIDEWKPSIAALETSAHTRNSRAIWNAPRRFGDRTQRESCLMFCS